MVYGISCTLYSHVQVCSMVFLHIATKIETRLIYPDGPDQIGCCLDRMDIYQLPDDPGL